MSPLANGGIGAVFWLAICCATLPSPLAPSWAVLLLLLAALALVPLGLGVARAASSTILVLQLPAALLLAGSFLLEQSWLAALAATPWLGVTAAIAWQALQRV